MTSRASPGQSEQAVEMLEELSNEEREGIALTPLERRRQRQKLFARSKNAPVLRGFAPHPSLDGFLHQLRYETEFVVRHSRALGLAHDLSMKPFFDESAEVHFIFGTLIRHN
jgi:hypothetical protein